MVTMDQELRIVIAFLTRAAKDTRSRIVKKLLAEAIILIEKKDLVDASRILQAAVKKARVVEVRSLIKSANLTLEKWIGRL